MTYTFCFKHLRDAFQIFVLPYSFFFFCPFLLFSPIYFYQLEANYLTILQWFLPYIDMNQPWIYMCSPSRSSLPPPSPSHPSGSSQCTSPEYLSRAPSLGWRSVSSLIVYLFQCYSLRSSHPCLLPQSKSLFCTSVSLFLFCIQGYHYHLFKFHIYALVYYIGLYLSGLLHSV